MYNMHVRMYVLYVHVCMYVCMYCMYMCVRVCTYACICVHVHVCTVHKYAPLGECWIQHVMCVYTIVLEFCSGQNVSASNWLLHESRCARINIVCPKCKEPVLKANLEEHEEEYHAIESCDLCRKRVEKWLMDKHKVRGSLYSYTYLFTYGTVHKKRQQS